MAQSSGNVPILSAHCPLTEPDRSRYIEKVCVCDGLDPYLIESDQLTTDIQMWPAVQSMDIVTYLVLTTHHTTKEQMKAYKSLEAHNFFTSGLVNPSIGARVLAGDKVLLIAKVC